LIVTPLVRIVRLDDAPENVTTPLADHVKFDAGREIDPSIFHVAEPASAIVWSRPETVRFRIVGPVATSVTVKPAPLSLLPSKTTSSPDTGGPAPLAPPEEAAQVPVLVEFQLPDPPTQ
jgi:hypothetical protein